MKIDTIGSKTLILLKVKKKKAHLFIDWLAPPRSAVIEDPVAILTIYIDGRFCTVATSDPSMEP